MEKKNQKCHPFPYKNKLSLSFLYHLANKYNTFLVLELNIQPLVTVFVALPLLLSLQLFFTLPHLLTLLLIKYFSPSLARVYFSPFSILKKFLVFFFSIDFAPTAEKNKRFG